MKKLITYFCAAMLCTGMLLHAQTEDPSEKAAPAAAVSSYPLESAFQKRKDILINQVANYSLASYRKGWFARGGDPAKYVIPITLAKQTLDRDDVEAIQYMNDNRTPKEHYHFAANGWMRYLGLFKDTLSEKTIQTIKQRAGGNLLNGKGTDNHEVMWRTAAFLYGDMGLTNTKNGGKKWLKAYSKNLLHYGQPEWDSARYVPYSFTGFMSIYDFAKDQEARIIAKASLDWWMAKYAERYTNGLHAGPSERHMPMVSNKSTIDHFGWLWWGIEGDEIPNKRSRLAVHAATSNYRPNEVISNIAMRQVDMPYESWNTKPNYWSGLDDKWKSPKKNVALETVFVSEKFTLGTLWFGPDICSQLGRLQGSIKTPTGAIGFTGGHPGTKNGKVSWTDAQGSIIEHAASVNGKNHPFMKAVYAQQMQVGSTVACLAVFPVNEKHKFTFVSIPEGGSAVRQANNIWVIKSHEVTIVVRGLTSDSQRDVTAMKRNNFNYIKFPGEVSGFLMTVIDAKSGTLEAAIKQLKTAKYTKSKTAPSLSFTALDGRKVNMKYTRPLKASGPSKTYQGKNGNFKVYDNQINHRAEVSINGKKVNYDSLAQHKSPYIYNNDGVLIVNDGKQGFKIDYTGELPIYSKWDGKRPWMK